MSASHLRIPAEQTAEPLNYLVFYTGGCTFITLLMQYVKKYFLVNEVEKTQQFASFLRLFLLDQIDETTDDSSCIQLSVIQGGL
jgi:hypothetical protein